MPAWPEFDHVIVGGGSAGCVLANRLSADPSLRVLLLEAGPPDRGWQIHMPAALTYNLMNDRLNWYYTTEPQPHWTSAGSTGRAAACSAARPRSTPWSTSAATRWTTTAGSRKVPPAGPMPRSCPTSSGRRPSPAAATPTGATAGPLHVTRGHTPNPLFEAWIEAGAAGRLPADRRHERLPAGRHGADGHDHPPRPPLEHGAGLPAPGAAAGRTCACSRAASRPASCWSGAGPSGVEYVEGGFVKQALAAREVILAGGAINSPQLLMLSGIGPADELASAGVAVAHDLPGVGQNLQDHLECYFQVECLEPITLLNALRPHNMVADRPALVPVPRRAGRKLAPGGRRLHPLRSRACAIRTSSSISCRRWSRITAARRGGCTPSRAMSGRCGRRARAGCGCARPTRASTRCCSPTTWPRRATARRCAPASG